MDGIFNEIGNIDAIKVSKKTRNVIDGHMRVELYKEKQQLIPLVIWLDLEDEEEERRAILMFDQVGDMARINKKMLTEAINRTMVRNEKTKELIEKLAQKKNIDIVKEDDDSFSADLKTPDEEVDETNEMFQRLIDKWEVDRHYVWELATGHILIKGNSTSYEIKEIARKYKPDCLLTDPPYGIDVVGSDRKIGLARAFGDIEGDLKPFNPKDILDYGLPSIIWGANHFANSLPNSSKWLIWDKKGADNRSNDFADAEMAWCSEKGVVRVFNHVWRGAARQSERGISRYHPTQKPIEVMKWCIKEHLEEYETVLDMYGGSGTTGIASYLSGKKSVIIECDPRYIAATIERFYNIQKKLKEPEVIL
jgi:site-specific DNA-methyltransferase (adenine-specific)/modification methylase